MDRKRKLPARAAARAEQATKRRSLSVREKSNTPVAPEPVKEPTPPPPPPPSLPVSIQAGQPLPVIDDAQPDQLSNEDFQTVNESGVLAESLSRSRQKWVSEGLFEKYWTKPHKRKGVLQEEPNNPAKDTMMKVGNVTINIEPHLIEATMYVVKAPKPPPGQQASPSALQPSPAASQSKPTGLSVVPQARPVLQYGPTNGTMPPPPAPSTSPAVGSPAPSTTTVSESPPVGTAATTPSKPRQLAGPTIPVSGPIVPPGAQPPRALTPNTVAQSQYPPPRPGLSMPPGLSASASTATTAPPPRQNGAPSVAGPSGAYAATPSPSQSTSRPATPGGKSSAAGDAVIALLAKKASGDAELRDLMKRVATGHAPQPELARFQQIIDQLSQEHRQSLEQKQAPPPTADNTFINGSTVRHLAGEVRATQAGKPSAGTSALIKILAQKAEGDAELREIMRSVESGLSPREVLARFQVICEQISAEHGLSINFGEHNQGPPVTADTMLINGKTVLYYAEEVKAIVDIVLQSNPKQRAADLRPPPGSDPLVVLVVKSALEDFGIQAMIRRIADRTASSADVRTIKDHIERLTQTAKTMAPTAVPSKPAPPTGHANGPLKIQPNQPFQQHNPQALRSKGPPPASKLDITAVLFDLGTGDRYMFPKYSILDAMETPTGPQIIASFLIVRKGSMSEYGGDPKLDYYQPVTIRIQAQNPKHLDHLARVVAPLDEVRRYMDDVMDNMTRAEYVLLAMRLPRPGREDTAGESGALEDGRATEGARTNASTPVPELRQPPSKPTVLWKTTTSATNSAAASPRRTLDPEDEADLRYQRLIQTVAAKDALPV